MSSHQVDRFRRKSPSRIDYQTLRTRSWKCPARSERIVGDSEIATRDGDLGSQDRYRSLSACVVALKPLQSRLDSAFLDTVSELAGTDGKGSCHCLVKALRRPLLKAVVQEMLRLVRSSWWRIMERSHRT